MKGWVVQRDGSPLLATYFIGFMRWWDSPCLRQHPSCLDARVPPVASGLRLLEATSVSLPTQHPTERPSELTHTDTHAEAHTCGTVGACARTPCGHTNQRAQMKTLEDIHAHV